MLGRKGVKMASFQEIRESAKVQQELSKKTNYEIDDLLLMMWAEMNCMTPQAVLIEEAIARLGGANHDHSCHCGTAQTSPHQTGTDGCLRYMCDPPEPKPPETLDYPYKQQRGYRQHPCGCWSRWPGSENSLKG